MLLLSTKSTSEILTQPLAWPKRLALDNYVEALARIDYLRMYGNTILVALTAVCLGLLITFMSSVVLAKMHFRKPRNRQLLFYFFLMGMTISSFILLFPIYRISVMMRTRDTLLGLIIPYAATTISFNTLLMVSFMGELPREIDEAAVIDGSSIGQWMTHILLPMSQPVLTTLFVFNVIYVFNEYPLASVMIDSVEKMTLSLSAFRFKGEYTSDYGAMIAGSLIIIVPELIFYAFFQRYIIEGMTAGAIKG